MNKQANQALPAPKTQYFPLVGGLDSESAQLTLKPGKVLGSLNYESSALDGYQRIKGFERFDGRARPSDATYKLIQCNAGFAGAVLGATVVGTTSFATSEILYLRGTTQLVLGRVTGTYTVGETLTVGGTPIGTFDQYGSDVDGFDDNTFTELAADDRRVDIGAVPGSGSIRGVFVLGSTLYAMRDNALGTAAAIYKSTTSGWTLVPLFTVLYFTAAGGTMPAEGATVTKGGVSAVVKRVVTESGSWSGSTAAGKLIVAAVSGGPFTAGAFTAGITATCSGAEIPISLLPGGRLDYVVYNFSGLAGRSRVYGADGVNKGFEFDGEVLVPITTGMATDTPTHVTAHKNHLFFTFAGSLQNSAIGDPYQWSAVLGAAEITAGDVITGLNVLPSGTDGGALMVFTLGRTWVLYGSSSADWKFVSFSDDVGAQRWSVGQLGRLIAFDVLGVGTIEQSQAFGNFSRLPLSARIQTILRRRTVTASVVNREMQRMRLFFAAGNALSVTPIGNGLAFMEVDYGKTVTCTTDAVIDGEHRNFFGASDGYVYEADRGRSFDGGEVFAYAKLAFNHSRSPTEKKRFRRVDIETKTESACSLFVYGEYSMGNPEIGLTSVEEVERKGDGAYYDITNFDESFFDVPRNFVNKVRLDGVGTDLSISISSRSSNELSHTLQSVSTVFSPRRLDR